MYRMLERLAEGLAFALALIGGVVLVALIALTCVSIAGRALLPLDLGFGPIRGIYDVTEMGIAAAIFAFLPWTQMRDGHARVDLLEPAMPRGVNRGLDLLFNAGMAAVAVVIAWRLYLGMRDKLAFGETTAVAQIPVWLGYAASVVGATGFALVSLFCVLRAIRRLTGHDQGERSHVQH